MPTVTRLTSNGVFQTIGGLGGFDEISLDSGSIFFDGTIGDYIFPTASNIVDFGTNDFTIELWIYPLTSATFNFFDGRSSSQNAVTIASTATQLIFYDSNGTARITGTTPLTVLAWNHVAVTRSGTDVKLFLNGVQQSTTYTSSLSYISGTNRPAIGAGGFTAGGSPLNGYMSNVRVVKNTAVYTADFTPPTAPLTPVANTSLLLTSSPQNPYLDSSNNNFTMARNGTPRFNSLGPFYYPGNTSINLANTNNNPVLGSNTNIITSTTSNGVVMVTGEFDEVSMTSQSLRFNGSTGYLRLPTSSAFAFGTEDFTVEYWLYPLSFSTVPTIFDTRLTFSSTNGYADYFNTNGTFALYINNTTIYTSLSSVSSNAWTHIAVTRSGTSLRVFINGVQNGSTVTNSTNMSNTRGLVGINVGSSDGSVDTGFYNGHISNLRILKGTALYTANFAPPQMALTAVANTSLLLNNFEAQPFVDNSSNNNTITINGGVTANTFTPFANTQRKILNTGTMMVKEYDEYSGIDTFAATGGNVTTSGAYTIHTFTANGTFQVTTGSKSVEYLVVAGGGGGARFSGGGGAGGLLTGSTTVSTGLYTVTVGAGGNGGSGAVDSTPTWGGTGANSAFDLIIASGGGGGASRQSGFAGLAGNPGGSGGGASPADNNPKTGGAATPPGQGNKGGDKVTSTGWGGGGGGGAGAAGADSSLNIGGNGGIGVIWPSGGATYYAGGGGGSSYNFNTAGTGGLGGGGNGKSDNVSAGDPGTPNTGGGGGGGAYATGNGGAGGSGIVIIRYLT